ncbi:MAG: tetratricopeptide repeat protein [Myxococcota bacterium]
MPPIEDSLNRALAAYRAGAFERSAELLEDVLRVCPQDANALNLRGLVAGRLGGAGDSIAWFDQAVGADPEHGGAWSNRGGALAAIGRLHDAESSLEKALLYSDTPATHLLLGRILLATEQASAAIAHLRTAHESGLVSAMAPLVFAELSAGSTETAERLITELMPRIRTLAPHERLPLGAKLRDRGLLDLAVQVIGAQGLDADALCLLGTVYDQAGDPLSARDAFERALDASPNHGATHHNLAGLLFREGLADEALPHHDAALRAAPDDASRWVALVDSLARAEHLSDEIQDRIIQAFERPFLSHQGLERAVRTLIERTPEFQAGLNNLALLPHALDQPIVHAWLRKTRVLGPNFERIFTALRLCDLQSRLLEDHPELRLALAIQSWHTQFAWECSAWEAQALSKVDAKREPVVWALYRALPATVLGPDALNELHHDHLMRERVLAAQIPTLALTDDEVSLRVRAQYEEHPYPRLLSVHRKPAIRLGPLLRGLFPHVTSVPDPTSLRVLIAGCGTGQQILAASRYADAQILAVDLSRASLGVAARQVNLWGMQDRVRLMQADVLALDGLDEEFDVIECGGVLHHLADPMAGWRVLLGLLAPSGVMKIGVYSEHARADVVAAHALVRDLPSTDEGLRAARARLLTLPAEHPAHPVVWSPDFPSLAGFRDLVQHECEHRFTVEQLRDALLDLDLELLGFQHPDPSAAARYRELYPDDHSQRDLDRWARVEKAHPEVFVGMLQFWCRRAGSDAAAHP